MASHRADDGGRAARNGLAKAMPEVLRNGVTTTVRLHGDLDLHTVAGVRPLLEEECARHPQRLVVDLAGVDFLDSSGLHLLASLHRQLGRAGCTLDVTAPTEMVWLALEVSGMHEVLGVERPTQRRNGARAST